MRETFPERSATEQLLISTATDYALTQLDGKPFMNKSVYLDSKHLTGYDKDYLLVALRRRLLRSGAMIVDDKNNAELLMEIASGALSIDSRVGLIGLPSIPIPIPFASTPLNTPELALFKSVKHTGKAKILLSCRLTENGKFYVQLPILQGMSIIHERWYFFVGPFRSSDLDDAFKKNAATRSD